jgi:hypothetical protein
MRNGKTKNNKTKITKTKTKTKATNNEQKNWVGFVVRIERAGSRCCDWPRHQTRTPSEQPRELSVGLVTLKSSV